MAKLELKTCLQGLEIWLPMAHLTLEGINAIEAFEPPPNLRQLHIYSYFGRTRIPQWITSLIYLRELILFNWENLSSISSLERMPTLESLTFQNMDKLEFVGRSFLGLEERRAASPSSSSLHDRFPKLRSLSISECESWEDWEDISQEEEDNINLSVFPRLEELVIWDCINLKGLPHRLLRKASSLKKINLERYRCSLPAVLSMPHNENWWVWNR